MVLLALLISTIMFRYPGTSSSIVIYLHSSVGCYVFFYNLCTWSYILFFRVIYVVGHNIVNVEDHGRIIRTVMMLVYTEDSMLVLTIYPLRDLLSGQNYQLVCRYFANLYIHSLLGSNMFWYLSATFYNYNCDIFLFFFIFLFYMIFLVYLS